MPISPQDPQMSDWVFKGVLFLFGFIQAFFFFVLGSMKSETAAVSEKSELAHKRVTEVAGLALKGLSDQAAHNAETYARRDDVSAKFSEVMAAINRVSDKIDKLPKT